MEISHFSLNFIQLQKCIVVKVECSNKEPFVYNQKLKVNTSG